MRRTPEPGMVVLRLAVLQALLAGLLLMPIATPAGAAPAVFEGPVPRPGACTPGDRPETGIQGEVPVADRQSGRSREGYNCN
ncbi:MAG TPA: hypothetical protein VHL53_18295, partial [Acidimicrobiia bacterium]|nr:hypothetical protein [Acidimicrobiia bacterium]